MAIWSSRPKEKPTKDIVLQDYTLTEKGFSHKFRQMISRIKLIFIMITIQNGPRPSKLQTNS